MQQGKTKNYSTDEFMKQLWIHLHDDFSSMNGLKLAPRQRALLVDGDYAGFREEPFPVKGQAPFEIFKAVYQLENLFKRYRFTQDAFTNAELEKRTTKKFVETQMRLNMGPSTVLTQVGRAVVSRTRSILRRILGEYSLEEHMSLCRFGKRASVGSPKSRSYLDQKLEENPLTGSRKHIDWFAKTYLPTDDLLSRVIKQRPKGPIYQMCHKLSNTNVPKTWKIKRSVMPNTTLGSFYTHGVGECFRQRLKVEGLDLRSLQEYHKTLAQRASRTRRLTTADLSAASDSFTLPFLNMVLPRAWYNVTKFGRLNLVTHGKREIYMNSVMGMGIGFTFTLQTLVFYGLLKAISELTGITGTISVYGDDLIYPTALHRYVKVIFPQFGFLLNSDKTFSVDYFRESCGGDYYHGHDVRPFQPEGQGRSLSRLSYLALIYKTINGLLRRWETYEITGALHYLFKEILRCDTVIFQVPPDHPEYAGIRLDRPILDGTSYDPRFGDLFRSTSRKDWYIPWAPVWYSKTRCCFGFRCLGRKTDGRIVHKHSSYYWNAMRAASVSEMDREELPCMPPSMQISTYLRWYKRFVDDAGTPVFNWVVSIPISVFRSKITGLRLRRKDAYVASNREPCFTIVSEYASSCIWF